MIRLEKERDERLLEVNGSYWERYLAAAERSFSNFDNMAGNSLENFSARFGSEFESMIFDAKTLEESIASLAEGMARSVVSALGEMAAQWLAYQAVQMIVGKSTQAAAATTLSFNAMASQQLAAINAFASTAAIPVVGPAMAPAAATAAIAATSPMVAAVSSLALAGMAHDGIDSIPKEGTWLLDKGERVVDRRTNEDLKDFLSDGGKGKSDVTIPISVKVTAGQDVSEADAQRQGAAISKQIENKMLQVIAREKRPGGLLA
jgi:hypothetical protein